MNILIRLCYKAIWILSFLIKSQIANYRLRIKLWVNEVNFGANVTSGSAVASLRINKKARCVKIGNNVAFNSYDGPSWNSKCCIQVRKGAELIIGDNSGFNGVLLFCARSITVGNNVKVGGGTMIFDTDFHPLDAISRRNSFNGTQEKAIRIDDDVFIGAHCIIGKGVNIGARSIIAAGSVVVKSIPNDEVWGGNPAKFIRKI